MFFSGSTYYTRIRQTIMFTLFRATCDCECKMLKIAVNIFKVLRVEKMSDRVQVVPFVCLDWLTQHTCVVSITESTVLNGTYCLN